MKQEKTRFSPSHYASLSLRNFRGFRRNLNIPLAPLTFLVGPNSSGKSSIFDAFLLLTQSSLVPGRNASFRPSWGGPLVDLGSYKDTVFGHNNRLKIEIAFEAAVPDLQFRTTQKKETRKLHRYMASVQLGTTGDDAVGHVGSLTAQIPGNKEQIAFTSGRKRITMNFAGRRRHWAPQNAAALGHWRHWYGDEAHEVLKSRSIKKGRKKDLRALIDLVDSPSLWWLMISTQRVSSGRAAPKRWYPVTEIRYTPSREIAGPRVLDTVDPTMFDDFHANEAFPNLRPPGRPKIRGTISSVLRDLDIATAIKRTKLSPYHNSIGVTDSVTSVESNLIDVGYGASQVIPVIHACLSAASGPLFVEQPEIHLHPKAQGVLADLLSRTSLRRQVIVETHSVHMINRARLLVAKGVLDATQVMVLFVNRTAAGSDVTPISIDDNGEFKGEWPGGFFDERYEDTLALLKLRR